MKKCLIVLLIFTGFVPVKSGPVLGIKGGIAAATQDFEYANPEPGWKTEISAGLTAGIELEWPMRHVSPVIEIYYSQKGVREKADLFSANGTIVDTRTYKHQVSYISFALLAKWSLPAGKARFYMKTGPRLDLKMGYKTQILDQIYEDFRYVQPGLDFGLGIEGPVLNDTILFLEIRYSHDLMAAYHTEYITVKNRSMSLSCGVKL